MKLIILGFVLWFALYLPGSAESAEGVYKVVAIKGSLKKAMDGDDYWKACGNYFAAAESTDGKIIYFNFEKRSGGKLSRVLAFSRIERVIISIEERVRIPVVSIIGNVRDALFVLSMNATDYKAGLPCLANGVKI